ncbi:nicotinate-nucleotide adenylyltransferase [Vagococcus elongatus]|uniref:Probable nicotinate-nucleotide adenylyltransferase n=1 Tax=Vagococcus elongatus TaxID=180344 RepID=A0A430ARS0_9ENTE|nr:nicotinate-nucleotide adenylyltransferase [Vagococcus elongatus]
MVGKKVQTFFNPVTEVVVSVEEIVNKKRVGILGGNFNPVHYTHLLMADQVYHQLGLDEIYLMPSNIPPHQTAKRTINSDHRVKMIELAVEDYPYIGIEKIELQREGKSYTYDTMKTLKEKNPEAEYYFIIGGDMVEDLPNWHRIDELVSLVKFVGIKRPNYQVETPYPVIWVEIPETSISSSLIRKRVKDGCSVNFMLPEKVLQYIKKEGLYLNDSL